MPKGVVTFQNAEATFVGLETGQVSVTPTAVLVIAAEPDRGSILLSNVSGTTTIYVSDSTAVTDSNGFAIPSGSLIQLKYTGAVYAIVSTVTSPLTWAAIR